MHVLITGAAGMLGRKLTARLLADGGLGDQPVDRLTLADVVARRSPRADTGVARAVVAADLTRPGAAAQLLAAARRWSSTWPPWSRARPRRTSTRATPSTSTAPAPCWTRSVPRTTRTGTRRASSSPRPSRCTGRRCPNPIPEDLQQTPLTSYGTQKAIGELLLADLTRRGFLDGIGVRLPTVCIRPGKPNQAASGFFSSILREPLVGQEAVLPVPESVRHWHASPRSAVQFLVQAAELDTALVGPRRTLSMPGLSATVGEQLEALRRVAGERAVRLVRHEPDPAVMRIVETWAAALDASRAERLGFVAETSFDEIIRVHVEDELGGVLPS